GRLLDLLPAAEQDRGHLDRVARVLCRDDAPHERFVGPPHVGINHVQVPRPERKVLWLDGGATGAMDLVYGLGHLVEVVEILDRRAATAALEVGYERRPIHWRGHDVVAAQHDRTRGVASL